MNNNSLSKVFENGKAFIPFITAGDPNLEVTKKIIIELERAGADLIEIGIPFSDPVAEGPVIEEASLRALATGTTTDKIFDMIKELRGTTDIPLALMTYLNPIFTYGTEKFMRKCREVGVCCIIVPDLPHEEKDELEPFCLEYDVKLISLIAPTSKNRIKKIAKDSDGFIYCVSSMGVTGVRGQIETDLQNMLSMVKEVKDIPCAVGFGISTSDQAKEISMFCDGIIIGSAIVKIISEHGINSPEYVYEYALSIKNAIK